MAERRMFSKKVIGSGRFLRMPPSSRLLYYDLGMYADDDGVAEAFFVMRTTGATEDDLRVLAAKGFITILNEDLVVLINEWDTNNLLRKDRYNRSIYGDLILTVNPDYVPLDEVQEPKKPTLKKVRQPGDNQVEPTWKPSGNQMEPQVREGKYSLVQDSKERVEGKGGYGGEPRESLSETAAAQPAPPPSGDSEFEIISPPKRKRIPYEDIQAAYNEICVSLPACTILSEARKKAIKARLASGYTLEQFRDIFRRAEASSFLKGANDRNWSASFDWIIRDANMAKILSGNYDDHAQVARVSRGSGPGDRGSRPPTAWEDLPDGFLD
nr:MAG TPA: hypothetical protein [Caudoviricetes sp.]